MSNLLEQLETALRVLPSVGAKSASRMARHLLERERDNALLLSQSLKEAVDGTQLCECCRVLSQTKRCDLCADQNRSNKQLCIVEKQADRDAIERSKSFDGQYFLLLGLLSPIDGLGPEDIGMGLLKQRIEQEDIDELIIATGATVEGEATAHFIAQQFNSCKISRIAHGVSAGQNIEQVDAATLQFAIKSRQNLE